MTTQNRKTLYAYFEEGRLPTPQAFRDLVDSTMNVYDEGFYKTPDNGVKITTPVGGKYEALISFFRDASFSVDKDQDTPLWSMRYGPAPYPLCFRSENEQTPVLSLHPTAGAGVAARVGVNTLSPRHAMEVAGFVGAWGRVGTYPVPEPANPAEALVADGDWKPLTPWLEGICGFDVVASAGKPGAKRCALMHAVALNVVRPQPRWYEFWSRRPRIPCESAWASERCEELELQWQREDEAATGKAAKGKATAGKSQRYRLRIRSRCDYEVSPAVPIEVHLTQIWPCHAAAGLAPPEGAP